ncbi:MAG: hypothetical protein AB7I68_01780 [Porticoccaceae bacterium]
MTHKPLLAPGLHDVEESDLDNHFLSTFPTTKTRIGLILGLKRYLQALKQIGLSFEIWIDGSFTTEKIDPSDVDLVVFGSMIEIDSLPEARKQHLARLVDRVNIKQALGCDVLFAVAEDQDLRSYWRGWYGYDRDEQPKGIARIRVAP